MRTATEATLLTHKTDVLFALWLTASQVFSPDKFVLFLPRKLGGWRISYQGNHVSLIGYRREGEMLVCTKTSSDYPHWFPLVRCDFYRTNDGQKQVLAALGLPLSIF
ncbi:MAG: hypothetical protein GXP43_02730, partial [bacterium]|nr:hypothetical protein [bacterium]